MQKLKKYHKQRRNNLNKKHEYKKKITQKTVVYRQNCKPGCVRYMVLVLLFIQVGQ